MSDGLSHHPLAALIAARSVGDDADLHRSHQRMKEQRELAQINHIGMQKSVVFLMLMFCFGFSVLAAKMAWIALSVPLETRSFTQQTNISGYRSDIVDRNGHILATNTITKSLYALPNEMLDAKVAADKLHALFPELDHGRLLRQLTDPKRKFIWIKKQLSPEQRQAVRDLGEPGLRLGSREIRLYPNEHLAAHVLGGTRFGKEGTRAAEIIGIGGVEKHFDADLRDPSLGDQPLRLSIDLSVQAAIREVLSHAMRHFKAKGAAAVLMDVYSGEVHALVSLPDFDANHRPRPPTKGAPDASPLFNRAAQGVYELGSVFKSLTIANGLQDGHISATTMIDTKSPFQWNGFKIRDYRELKPQMSVSDVLAQSSNIGTARIALKAGATAQQEMLKKLGFLAPLDFELPEARNAKPQFPKKWSDISTITISYGHGLSATLLHLASAYASLANGGYKIKPTLRHTQQRDARAERVFSRQSTQDVLKMLQRVLRADIGTASLAQVSGYKIGGKTGTANKVNFQDGGYHEDKVLASFAAIFPIDQPEYTLVISLDEPKIEVLGETRRTAGWTAAPTASEIISRVAPILNLPPVGLVKTE